VCFNFLDEALTIADTIINETQDRVHAIKQLLLQMNSAEDARQLIFTLLGDGEQNRAEMMRLKRDMGNALRAILGNPNGYYVLDLAKPMDRMCLEKLLEISATLAVQYSENSKLAYGRTGDLSQKGNFSSFRNEMFEKKPITMTPQFASPLPLHGRVEFDFSGTFHAPRDALILPDNRVVKTLLVNGIIDTEDVGVALMYLRRMKIELLKTLPCNGTMIYECPMDRARQIGEYCETFYAMIHLRSKQYLEAIDKEGAVLVTDAKGNFVEWFERDSKHPLPSLTIKDYFLRLEAKEKAEADALAAEKAAAEAKSRALAERYAVYRNNNLINQILRARENFAGGQSSSSDSDSDDSNTNTLHER
jgi:hypothetical protein